MVMYCPPVTGIRKDPFGTELWTLSMMPRVPWLTGTTMRR